MRGTYGETTAFCVALNIMMFNVYCSNVMSDFRFVFFLPNLLSSKVKCEG